MLFPHTRLAHNFPYIQKFGASFFSTAIKYVVKNISAEGSRSKHHEANEAKITIKVGDKVEVNQDISIPLSSNDLWSTFENLLLAAKEEYPSSKVIGECEGPNWKLKCIAVEDGKDYF